MEVNLSKTDIQEIAMIVANILMPTIENAKKQELTTYTPEEVATITKRNVATIRIHMRNDTKQPLLKAKKIGKNWIITQENLNDYIRNQYFKSHE